MGSLVRYFFALCALLTQLTFAQVVTRTGDNAIKIPITAGKRVSSTVPPTGSGGGTLLFQDLFTTPGSFPSGPPAGYTSVGDTGCNKGIGLAPDSTPAAFFKFTPPYQTAQHCMEVYHGPVGDGKTGGNFNLGQEYWMGFKIWPAGPGYTGVDKYGAGGFRINVQMHPDNTCNGVANVSNADNNPMENLESILGVGQPWSFNIVGDTDSCKPYARQVNYPTNGVTAPTSGPCGNIAANQWTTVIWHWVYGDNDTSGPTGKQGYWEQYIGQNNAAPILCVRDVGINYYVGQKSPYMTFGEYYGQGGTCDSPANLGSSTCPASTFGEQDTYITNIRIGRAIDGIGYGDVNPQ